MEPAGAVKVTWEVPPLKVPAVMVQLPATDILSCCVQDPPAPLKVTLLKLVPPEVIVLALEALKVTVEEAASAGAGRKKKSVLPRTLVFDEIDIGIGGRAAEAVGRKLKTLSKGQQVLCITHLPQIAAFGDQHFLIEKTEKRGRTQTEVRRMEDSERTQEIARMLSGAKLTETSLKHAAHLLESSR